MSKTKLVLNYLLKNGTITRMKSIVKCNYAINLPDIIYRLKFQGWVFEWPLKMIYNKNTKTRYGLYRLQGRKIGKRFYDIKSVRTKGLICLLILFLLSGSGFAKEIIIKISKVNPKNTVHFIGNAVDPDGSIVRYDWDFNGDKLYDTSLADSTISYTFESVGVFPIELRVEDDSVEHGFAFSTVIVRENVLPIAEILLGK